MDIAKIIESIGWSQSVLIVGIIFIIIFRKEISEKIKTIKSVSKDGVLMEQSQEKKLVSHNNHDLLGKMDSITVKEQKELIKKDLESRNLNNKNEETIEVLVHQLAVTQLKLEFEKIYNIIFGSQIYLLKKLNENSKNKKDIDSYIENVISDNDELNDWTKDDYLKFLFSNLLIVYDEKNETYSITNIGHEFLLWLLQTSLSEDKRL